MVIFLCGDSGSANYEARILSFLSTSECLVPDGIWYDFFHGGSMKTAHDLDQPNYSVTLRRVSHHPWMQPEQEWTRSSLIYLLLTIVRYSRWRRAGKVETRLVDSG